MLLLVISLGKDWIVQSMLEFSAAKKILRIISDMQRVFWIVWFRMVSLAFLFLHPSVSSPIINWLVWRGPRTPVAKFVYVTFQPLFPFCRGD